MRKFKSIKTKFIAIYLGILVVVFLLMLISIQVVMQLYIKNSIKNNVKGLQSDIDESITSVVNEVAYLYARITKSDNVELLNEISLETDSKTKSVLFQELINKSGFNEDYFQNISLVTEDEVIFLSNTPLPEEKALLSLKETRNRLVLCTSLNNQVVIGINMDLDTTILTGSFLFYINGELFNSLSNTPSGSYGYSFIVRSDGFIVSHLDSKLIGKTIADGFFYPDKLSELKVTEIESEKKIIVTGEMKKLNLQYNFDCFLVSVLDYDAFYGKMITLERILYVVLLAIFALGVTLAVLRSRRLTLPISSLNESLDEVIATGQKTKKIAKPGDEIYQLEKNYDEMMDTIFELMEKNRLEMEMQRKYELYALQMQVNPHFLYNTLDAIAWMAKIKKQPEIEKLVLNLANFFRLSLHKGDKYVTINHEVELVKAYLEIYEIRFPDKVKVSFQIEEGIVTEKILKLLLQPIVENSLKHAFPEESGKISVKAYSIDNDLYFEVKDDGVGFDVPEDILAIKNQDEILHGYGLFNVNERIRLEYGEDYGLKVYSKKGAGTKITIKLRKLADEEIK